MEIILNCGDKINIPDGCKAEIKDGVITIEKEIKFKDGDILRGEYPEGVIVIFKEYNDCTFKCYFCTEGYENSGWAPASFRLANEVEKIRLFKELKDKGLRWNAEEKKIENIRWRAAHGETYFTINLYVGYSVESFVDYDEEDDNDFYNSFNYFKTEEDARKAAELVKETLKKFHEENSQDEKDNVQ